MSHDKEWTAKMDPPKPVVSPTETLDAGSTPRSDLQGSPRLPVVSVGGVVDNHDLVQMNTHGDFGLRPVFGNPHRERERERVGIIQ